MSLHPYTHHLLEAALTGPDRTHRLGRALFLYIWLITRANAKGLVCRESQSIANELQIPEPEAREWLGRLVSCGLIEVLTPPPHLVAKLPLWAGAPLSTAAQASQSSEQSDDPIRVVPVSSSKAAAASEKIGVGGAGEGVFAEVATLLGRADADEIRPQLDDLPEALIRRVIARVQATPERQIRVSKLALFRYLLSKLSHDSSHAH